MREPYMDLDVLHRLKALLATEEQANEGVEIYGVNRYMCQALRYVIENEVRRQNWGKAEKAVKTAASISSLLGLDKDECIRTYMKRNEMKDVDILSEQMKVRHELLDKWIAGREGNSLYNIISSLVFVSSKEEKLRILKRYAANATLKIYLQIVYKISPAADVHINYWLRYIAEADNDEVEELEAQRVKGYICGVDYKMLADVWPEWGRT